MKYIPPLLNAKVDILKLTYGVPIEYRESKVHWKITHSAGERMVKQFYFF